MKELGISHYKGKQFKYAYFVCDKREQKRLRRECVEPLTRDYPKQEDLAWKEQDENGKWSLCSKPPYMTDMDTSTRHMTHLEVVK